MEKKRVLVVEDEPALSSIVSNMLEAFGWESTVAGSAKEAKSQMAKESFRFIIIDLTLPDMPGTDLYKEIVKTYPEYRGQVILTSGFTLTEETEQLLEKDKLAFLSKPYSLDKFKKVIERWN